MTILRQMRRNAAGVTVLVVVAGGIAAWVWAPWRSSIARTIPTGAGFNVTIARSQDAAHAREIAARVEASGLPAFTRSVNNGRWRQVVVGPYVSIDEVEAAQRLLARRGYAARMLVDESVRRAPGRDGVPQVSSGANVLLIAGAGRLSVVVEMPVEPRQVLTRVRKDGPVGPRGTVTLEIDAGPVAKPMNLQRWKAPASVDLIERVSIEDVAAGSSRAMRTRIVVSASARSNVRVVGQRLYIDLWSPEPAGLAAARVARRNAAPHDAAAAPAEQAPPDYRETIGPAVARLEQMEPFVLSAVASPAPDVLAALARTLGGLEQWIQTIEVPSEWTATHGSLVAAVKLAGSAVEPAFAGDREARAREAFELMNVVKPALEPATVATSYRPG